MNIGFIYIAIYRVFECLEEEVADDKLSDFLNMANPYVFQDRKSADPAIYNEFEKWINNQPMEITEKNSFDIAKKYVSEKTSFSPIFDKISKEEWNSLILMIYQEEQE